MADENTDVQVQESPSEMKVVDIDFDMNGFGAEAPKQEVVIPAEQKPEEKPAEEAKVPAVDYNLYVKEKFGFDSEEVALAEIARLKEQKPAEEINFANVYSKKAYDYLLEGKEDDLYNLLHEKKKIEKILSIKPEELKAETAAEIVKMEMQLKYPSLTASQIKHRLNRQYAIPPMPKQNDLQTDEEYEEVLAEWKQTKEGIESDLIIDATIAMPGLEQRKIDLKLPEIQKPTTNEDVQKRQEELAAQQKQVDDDFKAKVPDTIKALNGVQVETTVKYGDVELPIAVSYVPNDVERAATQTATENSMEHFATTWLDEQGVPDPNKVASDMFFLKHKTAILQKVASESATQAIKEYLNKRANVKLDNGVSNATDLKATSTDVDMATFFLKAM